MKQLIYLIIIIALLSFTGYMGYKTYTLGATQDDYGIVCLGGHQYWRANFAAKGFLAIKLNGKGSPVKCR